MWQKFARVLSVAYSAPEEKKTLQEIQLLKKDERIFS
jgi:hypothetical protein